MTLEEAAELGEYAETVLTNPHFNRLLNEWDRTTVELILATKPDETEKREQTFQSVWAVREFIGFMQSFIKAKYDLYKEPNPVDDLDDPDVHDIYRMED
jgi:hypothetical protein